MSNQAAVAPARATRATQKVAPRSHPNASVALGSGSGVGTVFIWLVGLTGANVPPEVGAASGGIIAAVFLFVGKRGIKDAIVALWHGNE